jgi:hypothetical protein
VHIVATFSDRSLSQWATKLEAFASGAGAAGLAQAINQAGRVIRQATVLAETAQTGLEAKTIERAQHELDASGGNLAYTITARGGNVRLKYFGAVEGSGGITAHPWGQSHFYKGAFITSGPKGRRTPSSKLGGQVFENVSGGRWHGKIKQTRSGLAIPTEMVTGRTAAVFNAGAAAALQGIVVKRLGSLLG